VRTLDLVVDRLADVVEQTGRLRDVDVRADLGREGPGDHRDLQRVVEDVLSVAGPELHPAEELDQVGWRPTTLAS
jgi:hypothetical protein